VLVPLSVALRRLLGPAAILYENDCSSSITGSEDPVAPPPNGTTGLDRIAPELNYVSVDIYAGYGECAGVTAGTVGLQRAVQ